jgi:hypothetical protein
VVKSPKECRTLVVDPADLKYRVLMIHKDRDQLKGTKVLQHIVSAERKGLHKRPTMKARGERWYDLGERETSSLGWPYMSRTRLFAVANPHACYFDCEFFDVYAPSGHATVVSALANSTLFWLMVETLTRSYGGGGGPLKVQVYELLAVPIVRLTCMEPTVQKRLGHAFERMAAQGRGDVFAEIGAQIPSQVTLAAVRPDRRALDQIVMGEILGLGEGEQLEVYRAVVDLVRSRIDRAKSVDTGSRTRDGLDLDALKDTIVKHVVKEP